MMECRILIHFVYVVCCLVVLRACLALQDLDGCGSKRRRHDASTVAALMWKIPPYEAGDSGVGCDASDQEHLCPDLELETKLCWGYEKNCTKEQRLFVPNCEDPARPWATTLEEKGEQFWYQGDFGYVKQVVDSLMELCAPQALDDSSLRCSTNLRLCTATNLYIDFTRFREMSQKEGKYKMFLEDIFNEGEIGGHCKFNSELHHQQGNNKSPLQSWYAELEQFAPLHFKPGSTADQEQHCDQVISKPTVFIKLDAGVNMYHHFCDFFNLYASQHANGSFDDDIHIVMWDTSYRLYGDLFPETWRAFSRHPLKRLSDFEGKRMCFRNALFPLLARMMRGLFYNTYLVPGCQGSGLMQAFTKHLLPRLDITQEQSSPEQVRVTLLSRSSKHRRIVNQDELVNAMKTVGYFSVKVVDYKYRVYPYLDQLQSTHNSDIFMGMHGAGLTHLLFLPDWAAVFEIYNTEDPRCYKDLARLRGVQYITWEKDDKKWEDAPGIHPTMGTHHAKFTNYTFDVEEFMRLVTGVAQQVLERKRAHLNPQLLGGEQQHSSTAHR